jgi:hypothetical protein
MNPSVCLIADSVNLQIKILPRGDEDQRSRVSSVRADN